MSSIDKKLVVNPVLCFISSALKLKSIEDTAAVCTDFMTALILVRLQYYSIVLLNLEKNITWLKNH